MDKYLNRLCNAIRAGRFNDENYRQRKSWYGKDIMTEPLFCSYGTIGFSVMVYDCYEHFCTVQWDGELHKLTIDDESWKDYINILFLEDFDITSNGDGELECYTDAGEDMIISLDKVRKKNLQEYIDNFDINEQVLLWWQDGRPGKGVPFANVKEHYEDYEAYLEKLQKACDKMPF
jgi:hypothetical protein